MLPRPLHLGVRISSFSPHPLQVLRHRKYDLSYELKAKMTSKPPKTTTTPTVRDNVRQFVFSSISGGPKVFVSKNVYILDCTLR